VLPPDLRHTVPRPVTLTAGGWIAVAACLAGLIGSIGFGVFLWTKLGADTALKAEMERSGASADATVTSVRRRRGENPRTDIRYRYTVQGVEYSGSARLGRRASVSEGSSVRIRYLPLRPSRNWLEGQGPRPTPPAVAAAIPAGGLLLASVVGVIIRRQRHLLSEGRAAMARVTSVKKTGSGKETKWKVHYEWQLLSGATRSGRTDKSRPAAEGTFVPLVYDPDNPKRHAAWPLSLVRVARW
jgi:hypothetical protein